MAYEVNAENVIRKKSYKGRIIFDVCFLLVMLAIEFVMAYQHLLYLKLYGPQSNAFLSVLAGLPHYFRMDGSLPMTKALWKELVNCILALWPLNVCVLVFLLFLLRKKKNFEGMEHGSARWATQAEKKAFYKESSQGCIPIADKIFIDPVHNSLPNINEIDIGGSGSGKSFRKLIPDILHMFGSYIITDVKGDLFKFLYKILQQNGYKVRVLNLENLKYSNTFNPILYCTDDTDIDKLVNAFVINSRREGANTGEGFWEDTLSMLLFSAIKYITQTEGEDKSFERCLRLAASIQLVNGKVAPSCEIERIMTALELQDPYSSAVLNWKLVKQAPPETLQSVIISLTSRLRLWANEDLRILTQTDEMDFDSLAKEKTALFLIIPEGDSTYRCVSSMFILTAVQRLKHIAKTQYNGELPMLVSFELDEFANTGILPNWAETVSTIRSQNIRAMMVLQDEQQLKKNYEKDHKTIMSNCAIFNFLGSNDPETTKLITEKLGKTTIKEDSHSYHGGITPTSKDNISERNLGRDLMTKDEVARKPPQKSIIFIDNCYPMYVDKYHTESHPFFSLLGNNSGPKSRNNTDIRELYDVLYQEHKEMYWEIKKAREQPVSMFDDPIETEGRIHDRPEEQDEKQIEAEFERQFIKDLKQANK